MSYITDSIIKEKAVKINQDPNARRPGKYSLRKWQETASKVDETLARQKTQTECILGKGGGVRGTEGMDSEAC